MYKNVTKCEKTQYKGTVSFILSDKLIYDKPHTEFPFTIIMYYRQETDA